MEKKYLQGNLNKNIAFGLAWALSFVGVGAVALGWIMALVMLLVDKELLELEEKRELVSVIICAAAATLLSWTLLVPLYLTVCIIIAAVQAFMGKTFKIPGVYQIAAAIIK